MNLTETIITCVLTSGVVSFAVREWIKNRFSRDLEKFKSDLSLENQTLRSQIEIQQLKFKSELTRVENEHQTRFSQTYSIKAQMIRQLYEKLIKAEKSFIDLLKPLKWSGEEPEEEQAKKAVEHGNSLMNFFHENEIIFDENICRTVDQINKELMERWSEYNVGNMIKNQGGSADNQWAKNRWENFDKTFKQTIPELKDELKKKFREELGITKKEIIGAENP